MKVRVEGKPTESTAATGTPSVIERIMEDIEKEKTAVSEKKEKSEADGGAHAGFPVPDANNDFLRTTDGLQNNRRGMTCRQFFELAKTVPRYAE